MLCHGGILGNRQHRGTKSEWSTSPLPSRGPKRGAEMLCHPCILRDLQRHARGVKSEVVLDIGEQNQMWLSQRSLPPRVPKRGRKCYVFRAFSGIPNIGGKNSEVATSPPPSRGPKKGRKCYVHLHSRGSRTPNASSKIKTGPQQRGTKSEMAASPLALGTQKRAEMLCHPCILRDPQHRGTKSELSTSPLPSRGPKRGRKCYVTPAFSGIPNVGEQIKTGCLTPAFMGAQKTAEMLRLPCTLSNPQHRGTKSKLAASPLPSHGPKSGRKCYVTDAFLGIPNIGEQNRKWLPHPCLLASPKGGGNATSPLHSQGSQTPRAGSKIRNGPQLGGTKSKVVVGPLPSGGPKRGRKCYVTLALWGIPNAECN